EGPLQRPWSAGPNRDRRLHYLEGVNKTLRVRPALLRVLGKRPQQDRAFLFGQHLQIRRLMQMPGHELGGVAFKEQAPTAQQAVGHGKSILIGLAVSAALEELRRGERRCQRPGVARRAVAEGASEAKVSHLGA